MKYPQHFNDSKWDFKLNEAQAWMDAHPNQRPSTHAQDPVERKNWQVDSQPRAGVQEQQQIFYVNCERKN